MGFASCKKDGEKTKKGKYRRSRKKTTYSARLARMIQSPTSGAASATASALASRASILMSAIGGKFGLIEAGAGTGAGAGARAGAGEGTGAADARSKSEVMMVTIMVMAEVKV